MTGDPGSGGTARAPRSKSQEFSAAGSNRSRGGNRCRGSVACHPAVELKAALGAWPGARTRGSAFLPDEMEYGHCGSRSEIRFAGLGAWNLLPASLRIQHPRHGQIGKQAASLSLLNQQVLAGQRGRVPGLAGKGAEARQFALLGGSCGSSRRITSPFSAISSDSDLALTSSSLPVADAIALPGALAGRRRSCRPGSRRRARRRSRASGMRLTNLAFMAIDLQARSTVNFPRIRTR